MNNDLLIITITAYIISIAGCLILSIALRNVSLIKLKYPLLIHAFLTIVFAIIYIVNSQLPILHYLSLTFVCSGLVLSGIILRSDAMLPMKIYFSLFLLSILFFLISPSHLFRTISFSWKNNDLFQTFHIRSNYFLEEQQGMLNLSDDQTKYKVIQSFGVFHKTIARDINFGHRLDSIRLILFNPVELLILRGYFSSKSPKFETYDSLDVTTSLGAQTEEIIHKTLKQNYYAH